MDDYIVIFLIVLLGFAVYFYKDKIFPNQYVQPIINNNRNIKHNKHNKHIKHNKHNKKKKVSFEDIDDIDNQTHNTDKTHNTESTFNMSHGKSNISDLSPPNYDDSFSNGSFAEFNNQDEFSNGSYGSLNSSMSGGSHSTLDSKLSILE